MTKAEAINAMKAGKTVTHRYIFSTHGSLCMLNDTTIVTEDDQHFSAEDFWQEHSGDAWENGWIVEEES